jgi:hypothetical protein
LVICFFIAVGQGITSLTKGEGLLFFHPSPAFDLFFDAQRLKYCANSKRKSGESLLALILTAGLAHPKTSAEELTRQGISLMQMLLLSSLYHLHHRVNIKS